MTSNPEELVTAELAKLETALGDPLCPPSEVRIRDGSESDLVTGGEPTFRPERRQCGGFRPFIGSGVSAYFVP